MYVEVSAVKHRSIVRLRTYAGLEAPPRRHRALAGDSRALVEV
jgi:hypothetical protein